jgi:flagella basal body P-ring formation protein FlgA
VLFVVFLLAATFSLGHAANSVAIELKPEIQTSNAFVRLGDVATFGDTTEETRRMLDNILLGRAPDLGGSTSIALEQVRTELRKAGIDPVGVTFKGSPEVKVTRVGAAVPSRLAFTLAAEIERFLIGKYKLFDTELVVEVRRAFFGTGPLPDGDIIVRDIKCEASEPLGTVFFNVIVQDSESRLYDGIATVLVRAYRNVLVARTSLPANHQLRECDVEFQRMEIARLSRRAELADAAGARLRTQLKKGEELLPANLKQPPSVLSREIVTVTSNTAGVELRFNGLALEDGAVGDTIRVQNDVTGNIMRARVLKSGLVSLIEDRASSK